MTIKRSSALLFLVAVSMTTAPFAKADQADNAKEASVVLTDIVGTPEDIALKGKNGENAMLGLDYEGKEAVSAVAAAENTENPALTADKKITSTDTKKPPSPASDDLALRHYYQGQATGELLGMAATLAVMVLAGAPALMITSAVVGAGLFGWAAARNRNTPLMTAALGAVGAAIGYVFPLMLVAAGGILLGPKIADWLDNRHK